MKKLLVAFIVILAAMSFSTQLFAAENSWLVGKWELVHDPDGSEKDWLEFTADGKAFSIAADGKRMPGQYVIVESRIEVNYMVNGKLVPITLKFAADKSKVFSQSPRTGSVSEYHKL